MIGGALSARRLTVAEKKLEIVQQELLSRGEDLLEFRKRDAALPIAINLLTAGLLVGGTEALLDTTSISTAGAGSGSFMHMMDMPAKDFATQAADGAGTQISQVLAIPTSTGHEALVETNACIQNAVQAGADTSAMAAGFKLAQGAEIAAVQYLAAPSEKKWLGLKTVQKKA